MSKQIVMILMVGTGLVEDSPEQADYNASSGRYLTSGK